MPLVKSWSVSLHNLYVCWCLVSSCDIRQYIQQYVAVACLSFGLLSSMQHKTQSSDDGLYWQVCPPPTVFWLLYRICGSAPYCIDTRISTSFFTVATTLEYHLPFSQITYWTNVFLLYHNVRNIDWYYYIICCVPKDEVNLKQKHRCTEKYWFINNVIKLYFLQYIILTKRGYSKHRVVHIVLFEWFNCAFNDSTPCCMYNLSKAVYTLKVQSGYLSCSWCFTKTTHMI